MDELSLELRPLQELRRARQSVPEYYAPLVRHENEVVRVSALLTMLERKALPWALHEAAIRNAHYGALRVKIFEYFQSIWDHEVALRVANTEVDSEAEAQLALDRARLECDDAAAAAACRALYLATGDPTVLGRELNFLYKAGGPAASVPAAVRNVVINPHDPSSAFRLLQLYVDMQQPEMIEQVVSVFTAEDLHPRIATLYAGWASLLRGDPQGALQKLQAAGKARPTSQAMMAQMLRIAQRLNTEVFEKLGDYRRAYAAYQELNHVVGGPTPDVTSFRQRMVSVARLQVPKLPDEPRSNWFTMTGFPRSGTTLLENALAAHPAIETFEELPTRAAMQFYLDRVLPGAKPAPDRLAVFVEARRRYYDEMERRMAKPGASVFIDKSPIRSADAAFMVKAFPDLHYIFSIRHPFDVVLSCFKQAFAPNMAMENFRTFDSAASFYDFTMTQWFSVFGMDDPRIHYLKYDDLVTDFAPRMRAVLGFLGVEWNDAVLDFATTAQSRASATPSYQKVRQGLTIGVQSSWRKYGFLFQTPAAKPLYKWAEFFGYPTQ